MAQGNIKFGIQFNVDKASLNQVKTSLNQIMNMSAKDVVNTSNLSEAQAKLEAAQRAAKIFQEALNSAFNTKLNTVDLEQFQRQINNGTQNLKQLSNELVSIGPEGVVAFRNITTQLLTSNKHLKQSSDLVNKMANTFANTIRWSIASTAINSVTSSIQKAWSFTKQLDTSLNDIRIVTEKSADEMERFAVKANKAAKELGSSTKAYSDAALIYYQQGLGDEQAQARADVTVKAANVTGQSAQAVSEQLTAVWNGYKVSAQESELYIDKLAAVAASTAADLEELSTGMSRVASAANIMGVDIDQLNAQLATIVSVTREAPESVGTALKTVYARMSDLEAGLDAETTLGEYTKQMAQFGINALDANGKLRDMGDVVEEIGGRWNTLSRNQQVALAQTIAGTRQYSRMMSLFDNWNMYEDALKTSKNSQGTLQKQQDIYMESTEAHLEKLGATAEGLYDNLFDTEDINKLIDMLSKLVDGADNFVESIGGGAGLLRNFGSIAFNVFEKQIAGSLSNVVLNTRGWFTDLKNEKTLSQITQELGLLEGQSAEAVQEILNTKQQIDKFNDALTEDEKKQANELLKQEVALKNKLMLLEKEKNLVDNIVKIRTGETTQRDPNSGRILNQQTVEESLDISMESFDIMDNVLGDILSQKNFGELTKRAFTAERKKGALNTLKQEYGTAMRDSEAGSQYVQGGVGDNAADASDAIRANFDPKIEAATQQQVVAYEALADIIDVVLMRTQEGSELEEFALNIKQRLTEEQLEQAQAYATTIENYYSLSKEEQSNIENVNKLHGAYEGLRGILQESNEEVKRAKNRLGENAKEMRETGNELEDLKAKKEAAFKDWNIKSTVQGIVDITGKISNLVSGITTLKNLGSIWNNEDLTTSEKLAQVLMNMGMALPMIIQGFTGLSTIISALTDKQIRLKVVQEASLALDKAREKQAIIGKLMRGEELTDQEKQIAMNVIDSISEEKLSKEKKESAKASIKKGEALDKETGDLLENATGNVVNATSENLKQVKGKNLGFKAGAKAAGKKVISGGRAVGTAALTGVKALGSALASIPVAGWIAAGVIAAVTTATVILVNARNKEKKALERAKEEQERMTKSLAKAQEAFSSLKSELDSYKSLKTSFKDLTKGTTEWNNALTESNTKILQLIDKYPELTEFLSRNADGVLEISDAGLAMIQASEQAKLNRAQEAKIRADQDVRQKQFVYDSEIYLRNIGFDTLGGARQKYQDALQNILEKADLNTFIETGELQDLQGNAITAEEEKLVIALKDNVAGLTKLQEELKESNRLAAIEQATIYQNKLIVKGIQGEEASILSGMIASDQQDSDYTLNGKSKDDWITERAAEIRKKEGKNKDLIKRWAEAKGIDYQKIKGAGGSNFSYIDEDGKKQKISYDTLAEDLATFEFNNQSITTEELNKYREKLTKINTSLSSNGDNAAAKNITNTVLSTNTVLDTDDIKNYSAETVANLEKTLLDSTIDLSSTAREALKETVVNLKDGLRNFTKDKGWDDSVDKFIKDIGGTTQDGLMEMSTQIATLYGEAAQKFLNTGGEVSLSAFKDYVSALGDSADQFVESVNWNSETLTQDVIKAYEDTGKAWDMTSSECYNMLRAVEDLNGGMIASKENFAELAKIVDSLDQKGDTISTEEFERLRTQYGAAIDNYFTQMQDGTYALIQTAQSFKNLTDEIWQTQMEEELKALEKEFDSFAETANTIANKTIETTDVLDTEGLAAAQNSIKEEGLFGLSRDAFSSGASTIENREDLFKEYLLTTEGASTLGLLMKGGWFGEDYKEIKVSSLNEQERKNLIDSDVNWKDIMEATGNSELKVDTQKGFDLKDAIDITYADMYDAVMGKKVNDLNEDDYKISSYSESSMKNWITQLAEYGLLTQDQMNSFLSQAEGDNLKIIGGNNDLINNIKDAIKEEQGSFDKDKTIETINNALLSGMTMEDIRKLIPDAITQLTEEEISNIQIKAEEAIKIQETKKQLSNYESQAEAIAAINSEYEQMNSLLDHQRTLIELTAGEDAYEDLAKVYESQVAAIEAQLDNSQKAMNYWRQEMDAAIASGDTQLYEAAKANWEEASNSYYENMSAKIELLKEQQINAINEIFAKQSELSLETISTEWDYIKQGNEEYLDPINAAYGIQDVADKFTSAINNSSNVTAQQKLRKVMEEELKILEEQDKLSEYDLKRAEAKLALTEKEIALQEAQANKSKMRLTRGADGTYSYQYVADTDAINKAQQELADAQQELYNIDLEEYQSNLDKALEYYERYKEEYIRISQIANEKDRAAQMAALQKDFEGVFSSILADNAGIEENLMNSMGISAEALGIELSDTEKSFTGINTELDALIDKLANGGLDQLNEELSKVGSEWTEKSDSWKTDFEEILATTEKISKTMAEATWANLNAEWDGEKVSINVVNSLKPISGATGMYTGEWGSNGKLAVLHEKELVLNKDDTVNILSAVDIMRQIAGSLDSSMLSGILSILSNLGVPSATWETGNNSNIQQNVNISAEFPNVESYEEIKQAFDELINETVKYTSENTRG